VLENGPSEVISFPLCFVNMKGGGATRGCGMTGLSFRAEDDRCSSGQE
jgi:hypothetical protein